MNDDKLNLEKQNDRFDNGISIKDIFLIMWRWKLIIIIIMFASITAAVLTSVFYNKSESRVTAIVEFQWDGINQGEYPNGQSFQYSSIFDANIFGKIIDELNLSMNVTDLQKEVLVTPIIPESVEENYQLALNRNIDYEFYPTSFRVSVKLGKLDINEETGINILNNLINEFKIDFERKYIQKSILLNYTANDLSDYDYIEAYEVLNSQVTLIRNALNYASLNESDFTSAELGIGFADILVRLNLVSDIEMNNMIARIDNYLLTKNTELLVTTYQYKVEMLEFNLIEQEAIKADLDLLIQNYVGGTSTIIVSGMDSSEIILVEPYLETLYAKRVEAQSLISKYEKDISYYETRIDRLNGDDPNFIISPEKVEEETEKIVILIEDISTILQGIANDSEILLTEYNDFVTRGMVSTIIPPKKVNETSVFLFGAIGLVIGAFVGVGIAFTLDFKSKNK